MRQHRQEVTSKLKQNLFIFVCILTFGAMFSLDVAAMRWHANEITERYTMPLLVPPSETTVLGVEADSNIAGESSWKTIEVRRGDTLSLIFQRAGLGHQQVHEIMSLGKDAKRLKHILPGQLIELKIDDNAHLEELVYKIDERNSLNIKRDQEDALYSEIDSRDFDTHVAFAKGVIKSSLFEAGQDAGLPETIIMDMAYIFGWDIDFALDIREGDEFMLMYEEHFLDGVKIQNGNILAAEFTNQGKTYKAIRYTDDKGRSAFFSPDGKSMRKTFLRMPVDFTRISSRYGSRKHPTLKTWRQHKGVDYAASRGTPIKASGDGKVIFRGQKGGYGKTVIIQHGGGIRTLYAHMNSFNRKVGNGRYVKQGQVIGYVGSTGRATGPHLHYEFRVAGVHRNPLTVKLPDAAPLEKQYQEDFSQKANILLAQFSYLKGDRIAMNFNQ
ncbi:MAG: M23 family metallopeptidase [Gammaproteobacteria bacterium]|nr:M23 family metallopeptidase [Gammaproteobacteria bacterium]